MDTGVVVGVAIDDGVVGLVICVICCDNVHGVVVCGVVFVGRWLCCCLL